MRQIYLLKFGGNALSGKDDLRRLSREVAELVKDGTEIVLVHGGGPEISAEMEKRGFKPVKIAGVRITDEQGLAVAEEVLKRINGDVVDCLEEAGVNAVGMPGYFCSECRRKAPYHGPDDTGKQVTVDLGLVGEVVKVDTQTVLDMLNEDIVPVIYPIGAEGTQHLNVNADTMAAGLAAGLKCKEMIAITDVPGILRDVHDQSSKIDQVTLGQLDDLIATGIVSGGMVPKVEACRQAILAGVGAVRMVNGKDPNNIVTDVMRGVPHGTLIVR